MTRTFLIRDSLFRVMWEGDETVKVKDIINGDVISVASSTPIIEVARQMRDCGAGVIPVCENGKFQGVITERDIVISLVAAASDLKKQQAGTLAHSRHPMISPGVDIMQAAKMMVDHGVRVLPVVQNGKLLGLFTLEDLARESIALAAMVFSKTIKPQASGETQV